MNLAEFHFIRPTWLIALLPLLVLIVLMLRKKLSHGNWTNYCDAELLPYLLQEKAVNQSRWGLIAGSFASLLMIIALAGPTWQRLPAPALRNDAALVIALNLSPSMDAADIKPSRLTIARYKIADILKQRKDGQTALLVYSGDAFTVTPLTNDTNTIDSQLAALTTDIMPSEGNNTSLVLEKSAALFKQAGLQTGQILLITDSVDDNAVATIKKLDGFQLSILGVGTAGGAPIALPEGGFLKDDQGSIIVSKLDVDALSRLASAGQGVFQTISSDDSDIQKLIKEFDNHSQQQSLQRDDIKLDLWEEQGIWLLLLVLPLGALFFRKGYLCIALLLLLPLPKNSYALTWQDLWQSKDQQGQQAYQQKDYATAAEKFSNSAWKAAAQYQAGEYDKALKSYQEQAKQSPDSFYNQGNTLAQAGQLKEAIAAYEKALKLNPNDADAKFNKELVEKELKKQQQDKKDDKQDKQDKQEKQNPSEQKQDKGDKQDKDKQDKSEQDQQEQQSEEQETQQAEQKQEKGQQQLEQQEDLKKEEEQKQPEAQKDEEKKSNVQQIKPAPAKNEKQHANEQWLNRIPDDPAGLLRRKFKYQYGREQN